MVSRKAVMFLCFLSIQNTSVVLTMRYVRTLPGIMFHASTAVFLDEFIKVIVCGLLYVWEQKLFTPALILSDLKSASLKDASKMAVPAMLYAVQKQLLYHSISNLDAAVYQVTNQLKVLSAAAFSMLLMRKQISKSQGLALLLLVAGVSCVQLSVLESNPTASSKRGRNTVAGLLTGLGACGTSGLAGVYTEMVLKQKGASMWHRSFQLSCWGAFTAFALAAHEVYTSGEQLFHGFTWITFIPVILESVGGILSGLVMKHADTVLKSFALGFSIVLSTFLSTFFFGFQLTAMFCFGAFAVISAILLYNRPAAVPEHAKSS